MPLARRFEECPLTRWSADDEFEDLVLAIVRNLPLANPKVLSGQALRRLLQVNDGVTSRVFRLLRQLAIEAIKSGAERLSDDAIDQWQPMTPNERLFARDRPGSHFVRCRSSCRHSSTSFFRRGLTGTPPSSG